MAVVVLGGGVTGLTSAYALGRAGIPTILLEATPRLGGKVATESIDGFLVEAGPDSFVGYRPAAVELCRELGIGDRLVLPLEPRTVLIRAGGRFARMPDGMGLVLPTRLRPFVTSDLFDPLQKLRMGLDVVLGRQLATDDIGVGQFLERRLGRALVDRLAGPLIGGVYGTPIDELSLDAVVPQLRDAERRHRSLLLASLADGRARRRSGRVSGSPFVTLVGGTGELVAALVAAVRSQPSVEIRTGAAVTGITPTAAGVTVDIAGGERLAADVAILATPAPVTAALIDDAAPDAARDLRTIPYGSTAVVSLGYAAGSVPTDLEGHGFLVAVGEPLTVNACTLSSRKWAGRAPDGALLARAFIRPETAASALTDDELAAAAHRDLVTTLGIRGDPVLVRVARYRAAMPHYTVGHLDRVAAAGAALASLPQLILAGAAYRGVGLPDCIAQGRAAAAHARQMLAGEIAGEPAASPEVAASGRLLPLAELPTGVAARIELVTGTAVEDLGADGIRVGRNVSVTARAPFGGPLVVRMGVARVAVPRSVAAGITVRLNPAVGTGERTVTPEPVA